MISQTKSKHWYIELISNWNTKGFALGINIERKLTAYSYIKTCIMFNFGFWSIDIGHKGNIKKHKRITNDSLDLWL